MIAGIGGASLGTEIGKALRLAGKYRIYGCDVSPTAYGLYESAFDKTFRVARTDYVSNVIDACRKTNTSWLIPGGEQPTSLLGAASTQISQAGIQLLANDASIITAFSNKQHAFERLAKYGFSIPRTIPITSERDIEQIGLPCIVKPAAGSGGSASVFFAVSVAEAMIYAEFIRRSDNMPIVQEYIDDAEGEFTIGVLSLSDGRIAGSVALRRALDAKLSVAYRGRGGVVSSGYSQGYIGEFPELCAQAEKIAQGIGSRGPINIQGRVRDGILLPFEINPRFSASVYLRALAGFNEIDTLVRHLCTGQVPTRPVLKTGWYLRSLTECYVADEQLK
ncbi:ATP-grasp domain-containing protein [Rhodanobacter sp. PCA2]|uniref:ATP-grasp domain-containing protein n=1 Tax=Rhodanobacter sp. PCA2 TaxID=2006117 RepID=UPI001C631162|nr:ATP-grasp domain-containing protein [Rhodanobacter sp. PCA2]